jgi:branched-subunit amino acid aminotransferase/4-amino-4-deoxychorismate lyase
VGILKNLDRINAVIEVLEKFSNDGIREVYVGNGEFLQVNFVLKGPTNSKMIHEFQIATGWELPEDLQVFLLRHNGARLFNHPEYSGGPEVLSLEDIKLYQDEYMPETEFVYPIVYIRGGGFICVNSQRVKDEREDYLLWKDITTANDGAQEMGINFTVWLDRFLISQGCDFWLWSTLSTR